MVLYFGSVLEFDILEPNKTKPSPIVIYMQLVKKS